MKTSTSVAQAMKADFTQRWTISADYVNQPLGCIVDYFGGGFVIGQRIAHDGIGYMEVLGFELLPEDVLDALCLPMHWLEPVLRDAAYGDWRVPPAAWELAQSVEVAA